MHAGATWLRLRFRCDTGTAERIADHLSDCGALSVSFDDAEDRPVYEPAPGSTPLWSRTRVSGLFDGGEDADQLLADLARRIAPEPLPSHELEHLADRDWVRASRDDFRPVCFGRRLWVTPSWAEADALAPGQVRLTLDPGLAFGTGAHPTTALCLEWLAETPLAGATVLDYGCGSGILALAAAKLGARRVWAVDHDPQARDAATRNAADNGLGECVRVHAPETLPVLEADVLVANILSKPLMRMAERLCALLRPGGRMALSGVLSGQSQEVIDHYAPWCALSAAVEREDWVLLAGERAPAGG